MKNLLLLFLASSFIACESEFDNTTTTINPEESTLISDITFDLRAEIISGTFPAEDKLTTDVRFQIYENGQMVFSEVIDPFDTYEVNWQLTPGVRAYGEVIAEICISDDIQNSSFNYLGTYQDIFEITADKHNRTEFAFLDNTIEFRDLDAVIPTKVFGRLLNLNGQAVVGRIDLISQNQNGIAETKRDACFTDERGYFELFVNPNTTSTMSILSCSNDFGTVNVDENDLNLGEISACRDDYKASYIKANVTNCNQNLLSTGFLKINYTDPRKNRIINYKNGAIYFPEIFGTNNSIDLEFVDPQTILTSPIFQVDLEQHQNVIDFAQINLCTTRRSQYSISINNDIYVYRAFFIEKSLDGTSKLILKAPNDFEIQLDLNNNFEFIASTYQYNCNKYQTWLNKINKPNVETTIEFDNQEFNDGDRITGSIQLKYFDNDLGEDMNIIVQVDAPLDLLN